jgi:predicted NBD/HSP70 family sugar kinase
MPWASMSELSSRAPPKANATRCVSDPPLPPIRSPSAERSPQGSHHLNYLLLVYFHVFAPGGEQHDNELCRGERGLAGSLGHSTADPSGRVCICGSRGCLETYLNPDTLLEPLRHLYGPDLTCSRVATLAAQGDDGCTRIIVDASERLATALANVVSVLVPQCIVVAGDLAPAGAVLTEALERSLKSVMPSMFHPGTVMTGQLGGDAAIGAAALIFEEALWSPMDRNGVAAGV